MSKGNKATLDKRVAYALYNRSETEIKHITSEFIRQITNMLVEEGSVMVDNLGTFAVHLRKNKKVNINLPEGSEADTTQQILVHFSKATRLKAILRQHMDKEMEKYGVDETAGTDQEHLEKKAAEGCPRCGKKPQKHGNVLICPEHGSEPFETSSEDQKHGA